MIKAIIVDDEEHSRQTIQNYLNRYCPQVKVLAQAKNIKEAKVLINKLDPELCFLDVEMPFGNAFDLLEQLEEVNFETIFVTAFNEYAIKALNFSASYYLLKPLDIDELIVAVERVEEQITQKKEAFHTKILVENMNNANKQSQKIVLPLIDGFEVVRMNEIVRCKANDNFTDIYTIDGDKKTICRTLKFYEELLSEFNFVRTHKSHLVNLDYVKQYRKAGEIVMEDGSMVELSNTRKQEFLAKFK